MTYEDDDQHFLRYQGSCSLSIHFTRPNRQLSLLCGNIEGVTSTVSRKKVRTLAQSLDYTQQHFVSLQGQF